MLPKLGSFCFASEIHTEVHQEGCLNSGWIWLVPAYVKQQKSRRFARIWQNGVKCHLLQNCDFFYQATGKPPI